MLSAQDRWVQIISISKYISILSYFRSRGTYNKVHAFLLHINSQILELKVNIHSIQSQSLPVHLCWNLQSVHAALPANAGRKATASVAIYITILSQFHNRDRVHAEFSWQISTTFTDLGQFLFQISPTLSRLKDHLPRPSQGSVTHTHTFWTHLQHSYLNLVWEWFQVQINWVFSSYRAPFKDTIPAPSPQMMCWPWPWNPHVSKKCPQPLVS